MQTGNEKIETMIIDLKTERLRELEMLRIKEMNLKMMQNVIAQHGQEQTACTDYILLQSQQLWDVSRGIKVVVNKVSNSNSNGVVSSSSGVVDGVVVGTDGNELFNHHNLNKTRK